VVRCKTTTGRPASSTEKIYHAAKEKIGIFAAVTSIPLFGTVKSVRWLWVMVIIRSSGLGAQYVRVLAADVMMTVHFAFIYSMVLASFI
jgi:hypothetical protein